MFILHIWYPYSYTSSQNTTHTGPTKHEPANRFAHNPAAEPYIPPRPFPRIPFPSTPDQFSISWEVCARSDSTAISTTAVGPVESDENKVEEEGDEQSAE